MSTKEIFEALRPAFYSDDEARVYIEILRSGPDVKQDEIAQKMSRTQAHVNKIISGLSREGYILEKTRRKAKKEYFLINPKMLAYVGYIRLKEQHPFQMSQTIEEFISKQRKLVDDLEALWKRNRVGLGENKESNTFDVYGWRGEITLANVCGWIETFRDDLKAKDKELMFFTPNLRLIQDVFLQLMKNVLSGLTCKCVFFVRQENFTIFDKIKNELPKGLSYETYCVPPYVFIDYLRLVLIGDCLGLICLKRSDNYVGTLFYRCHEEIQGLRGCLTELKNQAQVSIKH